MEAQESPADWCKRMQDEAKTGEEAMAYYELAKMWMERERKERASLNTLSHVSDWSLI